VPYKRGESSDERRGVRVVTEESTGRKRDVRAEERG